MTLGNELSLGGAVVHFLVALGIWGAGVLIGGALLAHLGGRASRLETLALAGPWGLVFIAGVIAAIGSRGTSMLTPLPVLQLALCAFRWVVRPEGAGAGSPARADSSSGGAGGPDAGPRWWLLVLVFAALVLFAQLNARVAVLPYHGSGQWRVPHPDRCWWAGLAQRLAEDGVESWSALTVLALSDEGKPLLHAYHYTDLWLTGYAAKWLGLNPLTTLIFVVHPVFIAMLAFQCAALTSLFLPRKGWVWLAGLAAVFVTTLINFGGRRYGFALPDVWYTFAIFGFENQYVGMALAISGIIHALRSRPVMAAGALGAATLVGQPLLPLLLPGLLVLGLWGAAHYLRGKGHGDAIRTAALATAISLGLFLWAMKAHTVPPVFEESPGSGLRHLWKVFASGVLTLGGSLLGLPFFVGLWRIWTTDDQPGLSRHAARCVVILCLGVWALASFTYNGLGPPGQLHNAEQMLYLTWAAFLIPVGWAGLCVMLATGPHRLVAAGLMGALLVSGAATSVYFWPYEKSRWGPAFTPEQVAELRSVCQGKAIGYFEEEDFTDEEPWWMPWHGRGWAVLGDCRLLRLNQVRRDKAQQNLGCWQLSAPAAYARAQGVEWDNRPEIVLGFAQSCGIWAIAELPDHHPIPANIRPYLKPLQRAGPLNLYSIAELPSDGSSER